MTNSLTFPRINLLQDVEVSLTQSVELSGRPPASREQCNCDCACTLVPTTTEQKALSFPTAFYLELTSRCPNRCLGCGNVFLDRRQQAGLPTEMGWKDWQAILEKISPTATMVKLTGGEPTISPHFYRIVDFLEAHRIPFVVLTSGIWSHPQKLLASLGAQEHFRGFLISLHGSTDSRHEEFTQAAGSYRRALQSIQRASAVGMDVSVSTILLRSNLGELKAIADAALAHGARNMLFARHIGPAVPGFTLNEKDLRQAVQEVISLQQQGYPVKIGNCVPQCFHPNPSTGCTAGLTFCTIDPAGNLRPCNHSKTQAGSLLDRSLEELWMGPELQSWRSLLATACTDCPSFAGCGGGCKVMYQAGRDLLMTSPAATAWERTRSKVQVLLFKDSIPHPSYMQKFETMGNILLGNGVVIPIDPAVESFLRDAMGKKTMKEIQDTYGKPALTFLADLYSLGLVEFSQPTKGQLITHY